MQIICSAKPGYSLRMHVDVKPPKWMHHCTHNFLFLILPEFDNSFDKHTNSRVSFPSPDRIFKKSTNNDISRI